MSIGESLRTWVGAAARPQKGPRAVGHRKEPKGPFGPPRRRSI